MGKFVELSGQSFGRLTALDYVGRSRWRFQCSCGTVVEQRSDLVREGRVKSCGCYNQETRSSRFLGRRLADIAGRRFGRLVVAELAKRHGGHVHWRCLCDCGKETVVRASHLVGALTTSCGCQQRENTIARFTTHGMSSTREFSSWSAMLARCENKNHPHFKDYGGRGISVCNRWRKFSNFYADMGPRPRGLTLDRINNDGNYEPGNCRWADWFQQAANRRPASRAPSDQPTASPDP
jgi:hypothetical protein